MTTLWLADKDLQCISIASAILKGDKDLLQQLLQWYEDPWPGKDSHHLLSGVEDLLLAW